VVHDNTKDLVTAIKKAEADYMPSADVQERLQAVTFVALIGPAVTGKTTLMRRCAELDGEFGRVKGFTSRERREEELADAFRFLNHDQAALTNLLQHIENRELVQFVVHPTTDRIYGSDIAAYDKPYMLLETLPGAMAELERLPFKAIKKIAIVTDPDEWYARFRERFHHTGHDDTKAKRLGEAIQNLSWSLDHQDEVTWLDNSHRPVAETAQRLIELARGTGVSDPSAKTTAQRLLATLQKLYRLR
jgi:guanylate kinase